LLATNPVLASHVQVLTHRCHLPPPAIFNELPKNPFSAQTLSMDARTIKLVELAVRNMKKVHTLRIIMGHPSLTDALLRCFFDARRLLPGTDYTRVRKLWLENCRVAVGLDGMHAPPGLPLELDFQGLERVRFRRLPMRPGTPLDGSLGLEHVVYSRGGTFRWLQDGVGGAYEASVDASNLEVRYGESHIMWLRNQDEPGRALQFANPDREWDRTPSEPNPLLELFATAQSFDDQIYERLEAAVELPEEVRQLGQLSPLKRAERAYRGNWLDPDDMAALLDPAWMAMQRERVPSSDAALFMLKSASSTLTSLNFDWVLNVPHAFGNEHNNRLYRRWCSTYLKLFSLRFPHLRAFQFRNCVVPDTTLPHGLHLLDSTFPHFPQVITEFASEQHITDADAVASLHLAPLSFMEAHPNIQCLAWPMDHFFSHRPSPPDITDRVDAVVQNLADKLTDLRVDTRFQGHGEPNSEETHARDLHARTRRRHFITRVAAHLRHVTTIKIEGGLPRDERREVIRALHHSPLAKIVMIGVCSPLGNTWGANGADVADLVDDHEREDLEPEDVASITQLGPRPPTPPPDPFTFHPEYDWPHRPPMLSTLAAHHAATVRELKFCGYKGAPVLFAPTAITAPLLLPLRHFHRLESLILSLWLTTAFESARRDADVIAYWTASRDPARQALVHITDEEPEGWALELRRKFAPDALAWRVTAFVGRFLSEEAKSRAGGVHVRASFCIGEWGGIFDVDLWIGKGAVGSDVCLGFKGPREEVEGERRREKLEGRKWF
jgi:hypothetical protein